MSDEWTNHMHDREAAEEAVKHMSAAQRVNRRMYLSLPTEDLMKQANDRNLGCHTTETRCTLIRRLEHDDGGGRKSWVQSQAFEGVMLTIVVLNAFTIGVNIDRQDLLSSQEWLSLNFIFFFFFVAESVAKVVVLGWHEYIRDRWNQFDMLVLAMVAMQMSALYSIMSMQVYRQITNYVPWDFIQILRICRLFRLARFFKELGMLIESFIGSIKALLWIMVLLFIWFYICACVATVFIGRREFLPSEDQHAIQELRERFKSIPMSMFSLFEVMTLEGWVDYVRPILNTRIHLVLFFLGFIFITAFFMLNLITAVVVDRTVSAQEAVDESVAKEQLLLRSARISLICDTLRRENKDRGEGDVITQAHFTKALCHRDIREALSELGWSMQYMQSMFHLVDYESRNAASITSLRKMLEVSHQALDTSSYVRFQINLVHRIEFQEKLMFTVLNALEKLGDGKITLPAGIEERMKQHTLLHDPQEHATLPGGDGQHHVDKEEYVADEEGEEGHLL